MGRSAASALEMESEMEAALSAKMQLPTIHTWMDILNGKTIDGNQIHDFISVGEEATMLIKIPRKSKKYAFNLYIQS